MVFRSWCAEKVISVNGMCSRLISVAILKYPEKRRLRRKGSLGMQFFTTGELRLELTAVSPSAARAGRNGCTHACAQLAASTLQARAQSQGVLLPPLSLGLSVSIEAVKLVLYDIIQAEASTVI